MSKEKATNTMQEVEYIGQGLILLAFHIHDLWFFLRWHLSYLKVFLEIWNKIIKMKMKLCTHVPLRLPLICHLVTHLSPNIYSLIYFFHFYFHVNAYILCILALLYAHLLPNSEIMDWFQKIFPCSLWHSNCIVFFKQPPSLEMLILDTFEILESFILEI